MSQRDRKHANRKRRERQRIERRNRQIEAALTRECPDCNSEVITGNVDGYFVIKLAHDETCPTWARKAAELGLDKNQDVALQVVSEIEQAYEGTFEIRYPSGAEMTLKGELRAGPLPGSTLFAVGVVTADEGVFIADPRAVIKDETGSVIYEPRKIPLDMHEPWARAWLAENPQWPSSILEVHRA